MINYDIGIQTLWNVPNYGTFMQAYALLKVIENISKRDIVQIAHLDQKHYDFYYNQKQYIRSGKFKLRSYLKSLFLKSRNEKDKQIIFLKAYNKIPHTETIIKENVNDFKFNKIYLGSDIIWDYTLDPFNKDPFLFGIPYNSEINSYAASFGTVPEGDDYPEYVVKAIQRMKHISVRDKKSASIVKGITGRNVAVVLDPTWLWDFANDSNIIEPMCDNYILVYGQDFTPGFVNNLIKFAKDNKLKIIALDCNSDTYSWCDKLIYQSELDPFLWVGYFKNASYIATSTFHGLTFSLIFKKKVALCKTDFIMTKAKEFLQEINLLEKFDNPEDIEYMLCSAWDYHFIDEVINLKKIKSLQFLYSSLNE